LNGRKEGRCSEDKGMMLGIRRNILCPTPDFGFSIYRVHTKKMSMVGLNSKYGDC
jgi:hypothetical protein